MAQKANNRENCRVFVYGTLKEEHVNNGALSHSKFLGRCYIEGRYRLYDLGWYPAVVHNPTGETTRIYGEVYEVDAETLDHLDIIEGHPNYYTRVKMATPWKNAWVYTLPEGYNGRDDITHFTSGVWCPSDSEQEYIDTVLKAG